MPPRVFRQTLGHTLDFIRDLDRARNLEDVSEQVLRHVAPFGVEYVLASTFPRSGSNSRQQLGHVLLNRWPAEWLHRYCVEGLCIFVIRPSRVPDRSVTPFFWSELDPFIGDDPLKRRVMDEASDFNLRKGFSAALVTLDGQPVGFSLGWTRSRNPPGDERNVVA